MNDYCEKLKKIKLNDPVTELPAGWNDYELIDCGNREKLERFGDHIIRRPEPQAVWKPDMTEPEWERMAAATFSRSSTNEEKGNWNLRSGMPGQWRINYNLRGNRLCFRLGLTSFKHVGVFPEQAANWEFIYTRCREIEQSGIQVPSVLNLFAYTGGASQAASAAGAAVTHVDSVKQVVTWARQNADVAGLGNIRWIVDDAIKFLRREVRRGNRYNGIILDPPAYGRGPDGEKWVLEEGIGELLDLSAELLAEKDSFLVLNLYSMGLSAVIARTSVRKSFGPIDPDREQYGELCFTDRSSKVLPLGIYYRFSR